MGPGVLLRLAPAFASVIQAPAVTELAKGLSAVFTGYGRAIGGIGEGIGQRIARGKNPAPPAP